MIRAQPPPPLRPKTELENGYGRERLLAIARANTSRAVPRCCSRRMTMMHSGARRFIKWGIPSRYDNATWRSKSTATTRSVKNENFIL